MIGLRNGNAGCTGATRLVPAARGLAMLAQRWQLPCQLPAAKVGEAAGAISMARCRQGRARALHDCQACDEVL